MSNDIETSNEGVVSQVIGHTSKPETFYLLWVEGSSRPPRKKYASAEEACEGVDYLINSAGCRKVHILKLHSVAEVKRPYLLTKA